MAYELEGWSPRGPVVELSEEHSYEHLAAAAFGRLAVSLNGRPEIFPIDFHVDNRTVVFRTANGTKLAEIIANPHVALEADERTKETSWSVVLNGTASVLEDSAEVAAADLLPLPDWIPVADYVYVRIVPSSIRGRSFDRHVHAGR